MRALCFVLTMLVSTLAQAQVATSAGPTGYWNTWTKAQQTLVSNWAKVQKSQDCVVLRDALLARPVIDYHVWTETVDRDHWQAVAEARAKQIAQQAGISAVATAADLRAADVILTNWIATASAAAKPVRTYYAAQFWTCVFVARAVNASGSDTQTVEHRDPLYGQSQLEEWGMKNECTASDIKAAMR